MTFVSKPFSAFVAATPDALDYLALRDEVENDPTLTGLLAPEPFNVVAESDTTVALDFTLALTGPQDAALDAVIAAHLGNPLDFGNATTAWIRTVDPTTAETLANGNYRDGDSWLNKTNSRSFLKLKEEPLGTALWHRTNTGGSPNVAQASADLADSLFFAGAHEPNQVLVTSSVGALLRPLSSLKSRVIFSKDFEIIANNSDWDIDSEAPSVDDPLNDSIKVRRFDDSTERGVGFFLFVPAGSLILSIDIVNRAQTAPGASSIVKLLWRARAIPDGAAVGSWNTPVALDDIVIPTDNFFRTVNQVNTVAALGLVQDTLYQIEITRTSTGNTLSGNWLLPGIKLESA